MHFSQTTDTPAINRTVVRPLFLVTGVSALILLANGAYLGISDLFEWLFSTSIQNSHYQYMFALHLGLGALLALSLPLYVVGHLRNIAQHPPNGAAGIKGRQLAITLAVIVVSGFLLTRGIAPLEMQSQLLRGAIYASHVGLPFLALFLYLKHRQLGSNNRFRPGKPLLLIALIFCIAPLLLHTIESRQPSLQEPKRFLPSLVKTTTPEWRTDALVQDEYCADCHEDSHERWRHSAHRFSSFNNPFYRFAVDNLRSKQQAGIHASRFCAGCHDLVPLLTGEFDQADFSPAHYPSASAGITCTVCHAISRIDSVRGNADFTLDAPIHYPFAKSQSPALRWFSDLLIKSNPDFHKRSFLKPLHKSSEFCGSCHKVSIPPEVNNYRWLRGQNHYDSFLLSGVSGHSVNSFYYPKTAVERCAECHMPLMESEEFGARKAPLTGKRSLHDHLFPAANTALLSIMEKPPEAILSAHQKMMKSAARINIIGFRKGGVDGDFIGPLNSGSVSLQAGHRYLIEVVVRTTGVGHAFTQGTADSNQVWVSLDISSGGKTLASSGKLESGSGQLAADSHQINTYLIDKEGNKIDRRNSEDIHTTLYNHQIPPGAADVIHYQFTVPETVQGSLSITAKLNYRKFDSDYYRLSLDAPQADNTLPVTLIDSDSVVVAPGDESTPVPTSGDWMALNDYGIGLFRKPKRAQFKQAEEVFKKLSQLGRQEGWLNLVRLYYHEGRLDEAKETLEKIDYNELDNPWTATWFAALINRDNGFFDEAIEQFERLINTDWPDARARGFDFSKDYNLLNSYATVLILRAKLERSDSSAWRFFVLRAEELLQQALVLEPENFSTHFGLFRVYTLLDKQAKAEYHKQQHSNYKRDDSANDKALNLARSKDPYADLTANPVVIYKLTTSPDNTE